MDDLKKKVADLLAKNSRKEGDFVYTVPSPETYPYQWLWDSCFHAIIYSHIDPERGKAELNSLVSQQFENGLIPHMIYWKRGERINIDWGKEKTSTITQPPMIAYSAWKIFEKDGDLEFLRKIYPSLFHYYKYLINERDPHERHILGVINPDESGEDNSPRFDTLLGLPPVHLFEENLKRRLALVEENKKCNFDAPFCMKNFFWVKDVPFNAIMIKNLQSLAFIADKLERGYDAEYFNHERAAMISGMRELMLEDGLFWSTRGEDYQKIKVKTWAIFTPLFAEMLDKDEAETLVKDHLLNKKEFYAEFPLTTVAMDETSFNESDFWRGPTWIAMNWYIYKGLLAYGFTNEAMALKDTCVELLNKSGFREYYNPHTGAGLGARDFTWGGLILDM